jgi:Protein of unknown function (DUF3306)
MTKDVENTSESFLSRWAKRKADVRAEEVKFVELQNENPSISEPFEAKMPETAMPEGGLASDTKEPDEAKSTLPTIESLTQESDFSPFMGKDVASDLRNQAMKKLFTNPHYNVQDGLDIYIGDYTKSDPIPLEMLRKMTQSKALFLFEDEEKAEAEAAAALAAAESSGRTEIVAVPQTIPPPNLPAPTVESETLIAPIPQDVTDVGIKSD